MPLDLVYSGKSRDDLENILRSIARDSARLARRWVADIEARCETLRSFPDMGVERSDLSVGLRIFPFRRAVIAYRILRVASGSFACSMAARIMRLDGLK